MQGGQDNLVLCTVGVVVAHEEQLVGAEAGVALCAERVAGADSLVGILLGVSPAGGTSVNLGVEVEAREEQQTGSLVGAAVVDSPRGGQHLVGDGCPAVGGRFALLIEGDVLLSTVALADDVLQLALDEVEEVGTVYLRCVLAGQMGEERRVGIDVHQVVVVQGTHETSLGTLLPGGVIIAAGVVEIEVTQGDTEHQAVVECLGHDVRVGPRVAVQLGHARVVPPAVSLVGGQRVQVPYQTCHVRRTLVDVVQVAVAVGAGLSRQHQITINLVEDVVFVEVRHLLRVDVLDLQVLHTRRGEGGSDEHGNW